jgi:hypothetical protein
VKTKWTYFISVPPFRDRTFCYHQNESKCKTHKKGHDLNYIYNTFILKVKHNFAELVIYQTNLKSRAGHPQWKKGATTDTKINSRHPAADTFPTNLKSRAGHRQWKKGATTDTKINSRHPTTDYPTIRNQQQPPTETTDHQLSAIDNRNLTTNNKQTHRYTHRTNNQQEIGVKLNAKNPQL